jgi:CRP-like cAMP-binding protein
MTRFFDTVSNFIELGGDAKNALASILRRMDTEKGEILVRENTICNYMYYIEKGLTRTYYYKEGKDITDWISSEGNFACSIVSFISRQADRRGIETLEKCTLYALEYNALEALCKSNHQIERLVRHLSNFGLIQLQQRFDELHFETATSRYRKFREENPSLVQRVPLGIIASYIGVSQETLSRIRHKE